MSEKEEEKEEKGVYVPKDLYEDFEYFTDLFQDVIDTVIDVGDMETLIALEHTLETEDEYVWSAEISRELNEKIKQKEYLKSKEIEVKQIKIDEYGEKVDKE